MKKPKFLTLQNINLCLFLASSWGGLLMLFFNLDIAKSLISGAFIFLSWFVYFEVRKLKDWGEHNINTLVKMAEVSAAAAYKLKQHGGKVYLNNKEL